MNFLQLDKSNCSIWESTCLGALHKLEGLCLHTHSGSGVAAVTAAARMVVPALGCDVERAVWLKKAGKEGRQELWRLSLHWREIPEGCGFGTARTTAGGGVALVSICLTVSFHFQTLPGSPAALITGVVLEMLGRSCTVALSAACSSRKTCKGECLSRSCNRGVGLQPLEAHGPLSPSLSQHSDSRHLLRSRDTWLTPA